MKILILDDEADMRSMLERYLTAQGMVVRAVPDPAGLARMLAREAFDLLVLDLSMPEEDGLSVCRRLRQAGETLPILMLTARAEVEDRLSGLEVGADDYLAKPFDPRELVARIRAQIRARQFRHGTVRAGSENSSVFGEWELFHDHLRLCRSGEAMNIKPSEHALLRVFVAHANRPLGRDRLIVLSREIGADADLNPRSIDVQVLRLRRLIEDDYRNPKLIRTVWNVGYVFSPPPRRAETASSSVADQGLA